MENNFNKILETLLYAKEYNINPVDPSTWNDDYRRRQQELAGIIPAIEEDLRLIKEAIEEDLDK